MLVTISLIITILDIILIRLYNKYCDQEDMVTGLSAAGFLLLSIIPAGNICMLLLVIIEITGCPKVDNNIKFNPIDRIVGAKKNGKG